MTNKPRKQIALAQNYLRSSKLVHYLINASSIEASDLVYEIGPGTGIITAELARTAHKVVTIEKDSQLVERLRQRFRYVRNVMIIEGDFLKYRISDRDYKIFANIPYNITADIMRKVLYNPPVPNEAYLVMQKEAAEKFAGMPKETQFSILAKPMFDLRIIRRLQRTDFEPLPKVDSVLLQIKKRSSFLIQKKDIPRYRDFVRYGFGGWKKNLKIAYKSVFTHRQWKRLSKDLQFPFDASPSELTFEQWIGLFECFQQRVPMYKQMYMKQIIKEKNVIN